MNNKHDNRFPSKGNPYSTLTLPNFATPSQIKKKFRTLSLQYHPDKRPVDLTPTQNDEWDHKFIEVQEARDFLLKDDFRDARETFIAKLKSEELRKEEDRKREERMDGRRKRMRDELESKIHNLTKKQDSDGNGVQSSEAELNDLQRDGKHMRESYMDRRRKEEEKAAARQRKKRRGVLESRQVRIKWSRKKMGGMSDDMISKMLSEKFGHGTVEDVELIGSKGNAALVTFRDASCCKPCVDAYLYSEEMRATYVGANNGKEDGGDGSTSTMAEPLSRERDRESVEERKLRHAAEREAILRKMEMGVEDDDAHHANDEKKGEHVYTATTKKSMFPPHLPPCEEDASGRMPSCLERLQESEKDIFKRILPPKSIEEMQIATC